MSSESLNENIHLRNAGINVEIALPNYPEVFFICTLFKQGTRGKKD